MTLVMSVDFHRLLRGYLNFNSSTGNTQEVRTFISSLLSCVSAPGLVGEKRSADIVIAQVSIFKQGASLI